jgi:hypothetical protein
VPEADQLNYRAAINTISEYSKPLLREAKTADVVNFVRNFNKTLKSTLQLPIDLEVLQKLSQE